jgi:hypothetical protein
MHRLYFSHSYDLEDLRFNERLWKILMREGFHAWIDLGRRVLPLTLPPSAIAIALARHPLRASKGAVECAPRAFQRKKGSMKDAGCCFAPISRASSPLRPAPVALQRRSCWRRPPRLRRASDADVVREACDEIHSSYHDFGASASSDIPLSSKAAFAGCRNGSGVAATLQIASIRTRNARASRSN